MTTITQKKKMSKSAWFLIFLLLASIITVAVLAVFGMISLQFVADGIIGYFTVGASSWLMGTILLVLPFMGGILFTYIIKTYIIGNKTTGALPGAGYAPSAAYPSAQQKDTVTEVG